jgi:hypothetical protein
MAALPGDVRCRLLPAEHAAGEVNAASDCRRHREAARLVASSGKVGEPRRRQRDGLLPVLAEQAADDSLGAPHRYHKFEFRFLNQKFSGAGRPSAYVRL